MGTAFFANFTEAIHNGTESASQFRPYHQCSTRRFHTRQQRKLFPKNCIGRVIHHFPQGFLHIVKHQGLKRPARQFIAENTVFPGKLLFTENFAV